MRGWICVTIATLALGACEISKTKPQPEADHHTMTRPAINISAADRGQLRADVLAAVKPFANRPEYAITDPAFLDPCIDDALHRIGDRMPTASERPAMIKDAAEDVDTATRKDDGLARLAALIAKRYAQPVITRDGDAVLIDTGLVAGPYQIYRGNIEVSGSPNVDEHEWATPEVVRFLKLGMAKYPDAQRYTAVTELRMRATPTRWAYTYSRSDDTLQLEASGGIPPQTYVSEKLGGNLDNLRSAKTSSLRKSSR